MHSATLTPVLSFLLCILFGDRCVALQDFQWWSHGRIQLRDASIHFRYSEGGKPPLLLIHGSPQHSLNWYKVGPLLAEHYTVIAPDNRGMGDSSLSTSGNYTAPAAASDHLALLNFLNISSAMVIAHDKGVGVATSLALEHPERVERLILAEYPLPGFGYTTQVGSPDLFNNWHLGLFSIPDAAEFLFQGRVKEMLTWYFWHSSYSGDSVFTNELVETYTRTLSKPGYLRAMFHYFSSAFFNEQYFTSLIEARGKLSMPVLAIGGEASNAPEDVLEAAFEDVASDLTVSVILKAGHWLADENPNGFASRALEFFDSSEAGRPLDTSTLDKMTTMFGSDSRGDRITPGVDRVPLEATPIEAQMPL